MLTQECTNNGDGTYIFMYYLMLTESVLIPVMVHVYSCTN